MKKTITLVAMLISSFSLFSQLMPNAGLEEWEERTVLLTTFEDPVSWNTPNEFTALGNVVVVNKSEDAAEGSYAAEMTTRIIPPTQFKSPGLITFADFSVNFETTDFSFSGGLFLQAKVYQLTGKYKFTGAEGDSAFALIYSFNHPEGSPIDTVGIGLTYLKDAAEWTDFSIPMIQFNENIPDTFNVLLMSAGLLDPLAIPEGSTLYVDDLSIETNVGIFELPDKSIEVSTFPNPARDNISFETAEPARDRYIIIVDQSGKKIREIGFEQQKVTINVANLASGMYSFIAREGDQFVGSGAFIVE